MLVDLTVNEEVVNRFKEVCKEHNFTEKILCSHTWVQILMVFRIVPLNTLKYGKTENLQNR